MKKTGDQSKPLTDTKPFQALSSLFDNYQLEDKGGYITKEFQDFGYRLALELDDLAHKSLYMRLSKQVNRGVLEQALSFVADAPNVKSKARLFMWKLKQLKASKPDQPKLAQSKPAESKWTQLKPTQSNLGQPKPDKTK